MGRKREGRIGERFSHRAKTSGSLTPGCSGLRQVQQGTSVEVGDAGQHHGQRHAMKNFGPKDVQRAGSIERVTHSCPSRSSNSRSTLTREVAVRREGRPGRIHHSQPEAHSVSQAPRALQSRTKNGAAVVKAFLFASPPEPPTRCGFSPFHPRRSGERVEGRGQPLG